MKNANNYLIVPNGMNPEAKVLDKATEFFNEFKMFENINGAKLLLFLDKRSEAFYIICHLDSKEIVKGADLDAVLDPTESEEYKLNRDIYTDTYAYKLMESDALKGRSFEDLVAEYDKSYRDETPLKIFGGQHRITAIKEALKKNIFAYHGMRVYFNLSIEQRVNIAMANNTAIAVSNDLLDRMWEDQLGADLRNWCQKVGLLEQGQNFADRRNAEGIPTVRIARTILVNYYLGKDATFGEFHFPYVCKSGPGIDETYQKLRERIDWDNKNLKRMGEEFAKLHKLQRSIVLSRKEDNFIEFANKTIHPCVASSWAFAAGLFEVDAKHLTAHYELTNAISGQEDPLNAKALLQARMKGIDPDTYRGLGARITQDEMGRMLELFVLQSTKSKQRKITLKLANAAIVSFEAKKAQQKADKLLKGI